MRRRLPPLNAVRAFEAACRHPTFEAAGDELGVTAGAVAQQVKSLEAWLGAPLFRRLPSRGVEPTAAARRYGQALSGHLDGIAEATLHAARREGPALTVSTIPSFAANWLIPRLGSLKASAPDLDIRVQISSEVADFARDEVDVAVRLGLGPYPGLHADLLLEEAFFPVCSATLAADPARPIREPRDLARHTLLHEESPGFPDYVDWSRWLASAGVAGEVDARRGPVFSHTFLCLQAAASGQGVALATSVLVGEALEAGRLVRPLAHEVRGEHRYWLVCPPDAVERPAVAAFRRWILGEVGR